MPPKKPSPKPISLNEEQQAVVGAGVGFWKVEAGPGSGKSRCLVERYVRLLREGVIPETILSLSFTATAAKNLRDRVAERVEKVSTIRKVSGSITFHSLALSFAQDEREEFPFELAEFPLAVEAAAFKMSRDAARKHDVDPRTLRSVVQLYRRNRIHPVEAIHSAENRLDAKEIKLALAYKKYEALLREKGLLDFDSLLFWAVEIMSKKPKVRDKHKYDFIQIDEAQDCSKIEWDLVQLISENSVLAVGDVSQELFSFRGSDGDLFTNMGEMFPGAKTLYLGRNYRSTPEIVDFIRPYSVSPELASKFHTTNEHGPAPVIRGFTNSADEAAWIVSQIKESINGRSI